MARDGWSSREREKEGRDKDRGGRRSKQRDEELEKDRGVAPPLVAVNKPSQKRASKYDDYASSEEEEGEQEQRKSKVHRKDKKKRSKTESSSEDGPELASESDTSSSTTSRSSSSRSTSSSYDSESSDEEERRRKRRKRRRLERARERERERERHRKRKERKRKRKEQKQRHKEERRKKKEKATKQTKGPVTSSWGKYGLIKEIDMWNKRPEFSAWLAEVKKVNLETLPTWEEKQMFKEYMEDFNTATLPKKYYDLDAYHRRKMIKEASRSSKSVVEAERTEFNDEEQRRLEVRKAREQQKEAEIEALKRSMQSGMAQAMREQAQLREEMQYQYRLGNFEAAAAIQRRLEPDAT